MILEENNSLWKTRQMPPATATPREDPDCGLLWSKSSFPVSWTASWCGTLGKWVNCLVVPWVVISHINGMTLCKLRQLVFSCQQANFQFLWHLIDPHGISEFPDCHICYWWDISSMPWSSPHLLYVLYISHAYIFNKKTRLHRGQMTCSRHQSF